MKALTGIASALLVLAPMLPASATWIMVAESDDGVQAFVDNTSFNYGSQRVYFRMKIKEYTISGASRDYQTKSVIDCKDGTLKTFRGSPQTQDIKEGSLAGEIYRYVCTKAKHLST